MKSVVTFLLCLLVVAVALYCGYTFIISKTLASAPEEKKSDEGTRLEKQQRQKVQDDLQRQRDLMHDRQRTLRYYQNR